MERVLVPNSIWQHYKSPDMKYKIIGSNVTNRTPIASPMFIKLGRHEATKQHFSIHLNLHNEIKLYWAEADEQGNLVNRFERIG